ncbi:hypothetical protein ANN_20557 [Periplaneta americana]|uniref:Uncharacterized protein n=1 Tax=Periplaneta americana TaxID=6978 RepID=A0ABQ8SDE2_PERAM|nr:hypothetical protein ANN_20557 [Periplaneta americana]
MAGLCEGGNEPPGSLKASDDDNGDDDDDDDDNSSEDGGGGGGGGGDGGGGGGGGGDNFIRRNQYYVLSFKNKTREIVRSLGDVRPVHTKVEAAPQLFRGRVSIPEPLAERTSTLPAVLPRNSTRHRLNSSPYIHTLRVG